MSQENDNDNDKPDLDAFLIAVESKLRGPFSSLELSRAVAGHSDPREYLELISQVLTRMDNRVQLRVLVGLLGIEPSPQTDDVVYQILQQSQNEPSEWTRIAAGTVQGILFCKDDGMRCTGKDALAAMEETCANILSLKPAAEDDVDPLFSPYYYSFLNPETLQRTLPSCMSNPHFTVNQHAETLQEKFEEQPSSVAALAVEQKSVPPAIMPGRPNAMANKKKRPATSKPSMFVPAKRPAAVVPGRLGRQLQQSRKPTLHTRKAGAAQKLLGKSRRPPTANTAAGAAGASSSSSTTAGSGRAGGKFNSRSKMKMIDVTEVQGLAQERQERAKEEKMSARKRKIMEAAAAKGLVSTKQPQQQKRSRLNEEDSKPAAAVEQAAPAAAAPSPHHGALEAQAAAALLAYQQHGGPQQQQQQPQYNGGHDQPPSSPDRREEMNQLLENSNKISEEDRFRVRQFFVDRFNPTPETPVYKLKLHEEKTVDPATGMTVKETYYVELDYNTFGYKKLRKTKKK